MHARWRYQLGILLLSLSPIVAIVLLVGRTGSIPEELDPDPIAEFTEVTPVAVRDELVVNAIVEPTAQVKLRSTGYSGSSVVTAIYVFPGLPVSNGEELFEIDGLGVVLAITPKPFHRTLSTGSVGEDVAMLQAWLAETGHLDPSSVDGRFGSATRAAVAGFNSDRGVLDSREQAVFEPNSVSWTDGSMSIIGETFLEVGDRAPDSGTVIALGPLAYKMLGFEVSTGESADFDGQWEWVVGGEIVGFIVDGEVPGETVASAVQRELESVSGAVDGSDRSGTVIVPGLARRTETTVHQALPVGTVISVDDKTCVYVMDEDGLVPQRVEIVGGEFGSVWIEPAPPPRSQVLANPLVYLPDSSCE